LDVSGPAKGAGSGVEQAYEEYSDRSGGERATGMPVGVCPEQHQRGQGQADPSGDEVGDRSVAEDAGIVALLPRARSAIASIVIWS
jgi:hypothetical protein